MSVVANAGLSLLVNPIKKAHKIGTRWSQVLGKSDRIKPSNGKESAQVSTV